MKTTVIISNFLKGQEYYGEAASHVEPPQFFKVFVASTKDDRRVGITPFQCKLVGWEHRHHKNVLKFRL